MVGNEVKISLRVYHNAANSEVIGFINKVLRVKVSKPPVKGRANKELITLLSRVLGIAKNNLTIIKGHASRNKVIAIEGLIREYIV